MRFKDVMTNEIIHEQCRVFTTSRVVNVDEVVLSIFRVLLIKKTSHNEKCVQV